MLDDTRIEGLATLAAKNAVQALIETQTILQLMVKKGLVTREEVSETRQLVSKQPVYKSLLSKLNDRMDDINEDAKFQSLFEKSLGPNGAKSLTDEEREYLLSRLPRFKKD